MCIVLHTMFMFNVCGNWYCFFIKQLQEKSVPTKGKCQYVLHILVASFSGKRQLKTRSCLLSSSVVVFVDRSLGFSQSQVSFLMQCTVGNCSVSMLNLHICDWHRLCSYGKFGQNANKVKYKSLHLLSLPNLTVTLVLTINWCGACFRTYLW